MIGTVTSGPIGIIILAVGALGIAAWSLYKMWKENFGGIRDFTDKVMEKMKPALDWLSDKIDKIINFLKTLGIQLGITTTALAGGGGAVGAFGDEIMSVADQIKTKLGGTLEELKKMADLEVILRPAEEAIRKIIDTMTPYEKKLQAINDRYDEAIERVKTIIKDEEELKIAIDTLNEGRKATITLLDREKTALEKVAEAKKRLADLTKSLTDKIYEFTHTEEEVKLRDINREYDLLIENAKEVFEGQKDLAEAIKTINEKRKEQIDALKELYGAKKKDVEVTDKQTEKEKELLAIIEKLEEELKEAGKAAEKAGILGGNAWENFSITIKKTTASLSNFTKEGLAAAIATIKMKFFVVLRDLQERINESTGIFKLMAEANLERLKQSMKEQIDTVVYGLGVYNEELKKLGVQTEKTTDSVVNSWDRVTDAVGEATSAIAGAWIAGGGAVTPPGEMGVPTTIPVQPTAPTPTLSIAPIGTKIQALSGASYAWWEKLAEGLAGWSKIGSWYGGNLIRSLEAAGYKYEFGTPYVPQTGLAIVHKGEEINPPGQRSYDQRKNYTSSINIQPGAIQIITPKFSDADGQEMFRIIERQAKMRGLKLVRE
ncbi:hypothetical protein ES705_11394 [subsurface metagenome]